jgi:TrbM protein
LEQKPFINQGAMMKKIMFAVLLSIAVTSTPAFALDPCAAVLCLSSQKTAPQECKEEVEDYFEIRVYYRHHHKRHFDPGATATKRYKKVLDKCPEAEKKDKDNINAMYGTLEYSPFKYY